MSIRDVLIVIFLSLGVITVLITTIGVFKFQDFYSKLHASGIAGSAGILFFSIGFFIYEGITITGFKIFAVSIATFIGATIGTHIIARVAYRNMNGDPLNIGAMNISSDAANTDSDIKGINEEA